MMKMKTTHSSVTSFMSTTRRRLLAAGALAPLAASLPMGQALAQGTPPAAAGARPIRLIVPYAAGGPIDVTARLLAEKVKETLGTVIIDNKPGAGGNLGAGLVAKAAPDGLTIGISAVATHAINPWLFSKMPYDADRDFAAITQMLRVPNVLVMNTETATRLKINTLADLIAYGKANPGRLNYGSGGNGSAGHLAGEMLSAMRASSPCTFPTTAVTRRSWRCCRGKSISTSTTSPPQRQTSGPVSSRHWA